MDSWGGGGRCRGLAKWPFYNKPYLVKVTTKGEGVQKYQKFLPRGLWMTPYAWWPIQPLHQSSQCVSRWLDGLALILCLVCGVKVWRFIFTTTTTIKEEKFLIKGRSSFITWGPSLSWSPSYIPISSQCHMQITALKLSPLTFNTVLRCVCYSNRNLYMDIWVSIIYHMIFYISTTGSVISRKLHSNLIYTFLHLLFFVNPNSS